MSEFRYEISILIGPCSQEVAEEAMQIAHEAVAKIPSCGPGTALNYWNDAEETPGLHVEDIGILG